MILKYGSLALILSRLKWVAHFLKCFVVSTMASRACLAARLAHDYAAITCQSHEKLAFSFNTWLAQGILAQVITLAILSADNPLLPIHAYLKRLVPTVCQLLEGAVGFY